MTFKWIGAIMIIVGGALSGLLLCMSYRHEEQALRQLIAALENPEQQLILELRYLCFKQWSAIMEEMGISETSVYRIHGEALKNIVVPEKWE